MKRAGKSIPKKPAKKSKVPAAPAGNGAHTILKSAFSKQLGCNYQTLQTYLRSGMPCEVNGRIDPDKALQWLADHQKAKHKRADLESEKMRADIAKAHAQRQLAELDLAKKRAELHSIKECSESLGTVLTAVWLEIQSIPSRMQSAFPEIPGLDKVATEIVNDAADKLTDFSKHTTGKELSHARNEREVVAKVRAGKLSKRPEGVAAGEAAVEQHAAQPAGQTP